MKVTTVPFAILRLQYRLIRLPLQLVEQRLMTRLDDEAPARLLYERSLGVLDSTVGNVLGDPELQLRGTALAERSEALARAATLDARATAKREEAENELKSQRQKTIQDQKQARAAKEQEIEDARKDAEERKRAAAADAKQRADAAKKQADDVAAQRKDSVAAAKRREEAKIRAAEESVAAAADSKLDDAKDKRAEAAGKRAQANRVEELADAEKRRRQAERAKQ
jgi:hypothetical protein